MLESSLLPLSFNTGPLWASQSIFNDQSGISSLFYSFR